MAVVSVEREQQLQMRLSEILRLVDDDRVESRTGALASEAKRLCAHMSPVCLALALEQFGIALVSSPHVGPLRRGKRAPSAGARRREVGRRVEPTADDDQVDFLLQR